MNREVDLSRCTKKLAEKASLEKGLLPTANCKLQPKLLIESINNSRINRIYELCYIAHVAFSAFIRIRYQPNICQAILGMIWQGERYGCQLDKMDISDIGFVSSI